MVRRYRRGARSEYGRRSIRVRIKAAPPKVQRGAMGRSEKASLRRLIAAHRKLQQGVSLTKVSENLTPEEADLLARGRDAISLAGGDLDQIEQEISIGRPSIGPKLIPIMKKGSLTKHGYSTKKSEEARHRALNKAVAEYGALSVFRKLKAQETLRKRTQPKTRDIFAADADWVRDQFKVDGFAS
jgi:hypothetical protein